MTRRTLLATVVFGALTGIAAGLGMLATRRSVDSLWYWRLKKARFQPPREAFAPVWSGLYAMIATSGAMVWSAAPGRARSRALALWTAQLALNAGWSATFFGARRPKLALVEIGALLGSIIGYGVAAHRVDRRAAWLVAPYAAWTTFATLLNAEVVRKNTSAMLRGWAGDPPVAKPLEGKEVATIPELRPVDPLAPLRYRLEAAGPSSTADGSPASEIAGSRPVTA